jgi:hypothetical protein
MIIVPNSSSSGVCSNRDMHVLNLTQSEEECAAHSTGTTLAHRINIMVVH